MKRKVQKAWIITRSESVMVLIACFLFCCVTGLIGFSFGRQVEKRSTETQGAVKVPSVGTIHPLADWQCDSPSLRLWAHDAFGPEGIDFEYKWQPEVHALTCYALCDVEVEYVNE